jgi:isochorismate hydrolase
VVIEAVEATGRETLLMAGLWTEVCLAQTAIAALADGYRVFFVSDCSGGLTVESHEDAKRRLVRRIRVTQSRSATAIPRPAESGRGERWTFGGRRGAQPSSRSRRKGAEEQQLREAL